MCCLNCFFSSLVMPTLLMNLSIVLWEAFLATMAIVTIRSAVSGLPIFRYACHVVSKDFMRLGLP